MGTNSRSLLLFFVASIVAVPVNAVVRDPFLADETAIDARIAALGKDVGRLLELASACSKGGHDADARQVYARVLEIDSNNKAAHEGLRHRSYDGKWFDGAVALAAYQRSEEAEMKRKGLERWKDGWVPIGDVPFLKMGWAKNEKGAWVNPLDEARAKKALEWKAAGYEFRADDNSWVAPGDLDKWQAMQWKCGDEWVDMAKANEFHSQIERPWELAGEHYLIVSTCEWEVANLARWHADAAFGELERVFGVAPEGKPRVIVLNGLDQYNQAAGNQGTISESEASSSLHGAYFADCYFDLQAKPAQHLGCGVGFWAKNDPDLASWGPCFVRWASAQSYIDAIDPSWRAVSAWITAGGHEDIETFKTPFWGEKKIPRWLRWGAATYVERFMKAKDAADSTDPWILRDWSIGEIKSAGGLHKLDEVFAFQLDYSEIEKSSRLYDSAGLVMAYLLDVAEGDKELLAKHEAFKAALKSGNEAGLAEAVAALEKALAKRESAIKRFAGL